ncbi:unnamed protein product [Mortierella alpina]
MSMSTRRRQMLPIRLPVIPPTANAANSPASHFAEALTDTSTNTITDTSPASPADDPADGPADDPADALVDTPINPHQPAHEGTDISSSAPTYAPIHSLDDAPDGTPMDSQTNYQRDGYPSSAVSDVPSPNPPSSLSAKESGTSSSVALAESVSSLAITAGSSAHLSTTEQCQGFQSAVIHRLDGLHDQGAKTQQLAQEIWKLQKQMNARLILIQSKTEAILNQQLELAEYPIPRLFIVLPEEVT